jgi:hypothetical protein
MIQNNKEESIRKQAEELGEEIFRKTFLVLLAHVQRRIARDANYEEPKFLRAFLMAFEGINRDGVKDGQNFMGVSTGEDPQEAYAVVIKKVGKNFEILELRDIVRDKEVGQREIMRLIQLSILLDNMEDDSISWPEALRALNIAIPGVKFVKFPNNQWKPYRAKLLAKIGRGEIPGISSSDNTVEALVAAESFSQVPQHLRTMIGMAYVEEKYRGQKTMSITTPVNNVRKSKIFEMAKDVMYGVGSEYMNPMENPGDEE